jgi:hypothetical protein
MPRYFFNLKTVRHTVRDLDGTELLDEGAAREHARGVAGELMRNSKPFTRSWRLDVCREAGRPCFQLLFVDVDESLKELPPQVRSSIEDWSAKSASLRDTIECVRLSVLQLRATLSRSERAPYIAAVNGVAVESRRAEQEVLGGASW